MKRLALTAVVFLAATAANAQTIVGSKHDFSSNTNAHGADPSNEICKYCHTPHHAVSSRALWNHTLSQVTSYAWSDATQTMQGTPLGFQASQHTSTLCMSCHDGTVAVGNVGNVGGGVSGTIAVSGASVDGQGKLLPSAGANLNGPGGPSDMAHNHPLAIPYAGETYIGVASGVNAATLGQLGSYYAQVAGVVTGGGGLTIKLAKDPNGNGYGLECSTCHDPHNSTGYASFLRQDLSQSKICLTCHNK